MTLTAQDNGLFNCTTEFDGYPATELTAENLPAMVDCVLTLEAYRTGAGAPYPRIRSTEFDAIAVGPDALAGGLRWASSGGAIVKTDGGQAARVEVVYPAMVG